MTEAIVAVTDYIVAIEAAVFIAFLMRARPTPQRLSIWIAIFFASVSAASFFGGTVHGFFPAADSQGYGLLWPATLLAMGLTALSMWAMGAELVFSGSVRRCIVAAAVAEYVLYTAIVVLRTQEFWIGIADNLPAILFLIFSITLVWRRTRLWSSLLAAIAPAVVLVAAALQALRIGLHPVYFNYNVLYHALQAIALAMFLPGALRLFESDATANDRQDRTTGRTALDEEQQAVAIDR